MITIFKHVYMPFMEQMILKYQDIGIFISLVIIISISNIVNMIQAIIHEFGHFIFGKITKHKLIFFNVFNLVILKELDKIKLRKIGKLSVSGQCLMEPPHKDSWRLCTLGGIILNMITIFISAALIPFANGILLIILFEFLISGIIFVLSNGIPNNKTLNDGAVYQILKSNESAIESRYKQILICKHLADGKTYKDIPKELFEFNCEKINDDDITNYLILNRYFRYLDLKMYDKANQTITHLFDKTYSSKSLVALEIALEKFYNDNIYYKNNRSYDYKKVVKNLNKQVKTLRQLRIRLSCDISFMDKFDYHDLKRKVKQIAQKELFLGDALFNIDQINLLIEQTA